MELADVIKEGELYVKACLELLEATKKLERSANRVTEKAVDKYSKLLSVSLQNREEK
jgi:hypothetical protein